MDIWKELYEAALAVQNGRTISPVCGRRRRSRRTADQGGQYIRRRVHRHLRKFGHVRGAKRHANMITHGESKIDKILAVMPDGKVGPPCCACREFMMQLDRDSWDIEVLLDYEARRTIRLRELVPDWWGTARFQDPVER